MRVDNGKWRMVKLKEAITIDKKSILPNDINVDYIYIGLEDIDKETGVINTLRCAKECDIKSNKFKFTSEHILYGKLRPNLNKVAVPDFEGICSTDIYPILTKQGKAFKRYVYHILHGQEFVKYASSRTNGANLPRVNEKIISEYEIPLPPLETQKQIAKTLDTVAEIIAMRKRQLAELDNLIKSSFYDMFGDPVANEKGWALKKLPELVAKSKNSLKRGPFGGALKKEIFVDKGYLVYEQNHALNNDYSFKRYFIDQKTFNELQDFEVKAGDILISCSGVYLGKLSIVPKDALSGIINQALLKVTLNNKEMNQVFFVYVFSNPTFKNKYITSNRGSGIPNLPPMSVIKNIDFITPPISLQTKFAEIVTEIEQQKALVKKAIDETQYLFNSLMSEHFE